MVDPCGFLMALFIAGRCWPRPVGKVTHLEGKADLTAPGGKAQVLKLGDPINNGDILRTKAKPRWESSSRTATPCGWRKKPA